MTARTTANPNYHGEAVIPGVVVIPHVGAPEAKARSVVITPDTSSRVDFGAHNNDLPNLLRALNERVFNVECKGELVPTPQPHRGVWKAFAHVGKRIARRVTSLPLEPLTCGEFLNQCPANKRALYASAAATYIQRGWVSKDAKIKAFVKFEKLNFTKKVDPAPRVIQPRTPVYNYALGRYTRRVEHELYHALAEEWGEDGGIVVMKGLTVEGVASELRRKWECFNNPVAVSLDASRFDQHVSRDALVWEHSVYKRIFGWNPELCGLLHQQLNNKGFAFIDGMKLTYSARGTRASGDMNTSLGNCLIMCTLVREYVREIGVTGLLANNGDDCVLFVENSDLSKLDGLYDWFLKYGFEMKIDNTTNVFEQVEFCQTQPVWCCDRWVMVRQPVTALGKDALCLGGKTSLDFSQWCYQVGVGGAALYGDMPVFCELYKMYKRCGTPSRIGESLLVSDSGFMRMSKKPRVRGDIISDDIGASTRLSFYKAFGLPPSGQVRLENYLRDYTFKGVCDSVVNPTPALGLALA
jgi:hypothetical protein